MQFLLFAKAVFKPPHPRNQQSDLLSKSAKFVIFCCKKNQFKVIEKSSSILSVLILQESFNSKRFKAIKSLVKSYQNLIALTQCSLEGHQFVLQGNPFSWMLIDCRKK